MFVFLLLYSQLEVMFKVYVKCLYSFNKWKFQGNQCFCLVFLNCSNYHKVCCDVLCWKIALKATYKAYRKVFINNYIANLLIGDIQMVTIFFFCFPFFSVSTWKITYGWIMLLNCLAKLIWCPSVVWWMKSSEKMFQLGR